MALASALAMDLVGSLSLVETVVECVYVMQSFHKFSPFEKTFFLAAEASEIAGQGLLVFLMVYWLHRKRRAGLRDPDERLNVGDAREHLERLSQDPIHALKNISEEYFNAVELRSDGMWVGKMDGVRENAINEQKHRLSMILYISASLCVTFSPTLAFGFALVVARSRYDFRSEGDEVYMYALTIASFVALIAFCTFVGRVSLLGMQKLRRSRKMLLLGDPFAELVFFNDKFVRGVLRWAVAGGASIYAIEKVFEVVLLVCRHERLMSGPLAESLVVFQLVELASVASIVYFVSLDYFFGEAPPEPTRLMRMEKLLDDVAGSSRQV